VRNGETKRETSLAKLCNTGRLKATELTARGRVQDMQNASLVLLPSVSQ
jgi:hypothetical protein